MSYSKSSKSIREIVGNTNTYSFDLFPSHFGPRLEFGDENETIEKAIKKAMKKHIKKYHKE